MNVRELLKNKTNEEISQLASDLHLQLQEYGNLYMLSFTDESDFKNEIVREMNGVILEKETNKIVHHAFSKTYDCFFTPQPGMISVYNDPYTEEFNENDVKIEHFIEGSLIRVYWYDEKWNIGTARSINGALSHWSSDKSFKELFTEALDYQKDSIENLDKNFCYTYILQHPESKICLDITSPFCMMMNRVNLETLEEERFTQGYQTGKTFKEMMEEVDKNEDITKNYLVYLPNGARVRVMNGKYFAIQSAINNNPSLNWVYLEAIKNGTYMMIRDAFKSEIERFEDIDEAFQETMELIHLAYLKRNVKRDQGFEVPKRYERTVAQLHGYYRKTKNVITKDVVRDKLLELDTKLLYYVLAI